MPNPLLPLAQAIYDQPLAKHVLQGLIRLSGRDARRVRRYLAAHATRKLQIGAGQNARAGWLNANWFAGNPLVGDAILLDATRSFPLPDAAFDLIYSEHMIEHISHAGAANMLAECWRVLRPGGRVRIMTPDIHFLAGLLGPDLTDQQRAFIAFQAAEYLLGDEPHAAENVVNHYVRAWGHTFIHSESSLHALMAGAGFADITAWPIDESAEPALAGLSNAHRMPDGFLQMQSITLEAVKPG